MRILFVSRDNGGAKQSVPTALLALKKGHEVGIVVEGLAIERFKDAGFFKPESKAELLFKGSISKPSQIKAGQILDKFKPDRVVITRSQLDSLESKFGLAANKTGIPLIMLEDYWAGYITSRARPDVIVTLDEYAQELTRRAYPKIKIVIAGNPAFISFDKIKIPFEVKRNFKKLRKKFGRVFLYAGGEKKQMMTELKLLRECLRLTKNWCLIVRPHPLEVQKDKQNKIKGNSSWAPILKEFGERIVTVRSDSGDDLAMLADATFSGSSTMLSTAAYARKAAISIHTDLGDNVLKEMKLTVLPLISLKCARQLRSPRDLDKFGLIQPAEEADLKKLQPFNVSLALEAIEDTASAQKR